MVELTIGNSVCQLKNLPVAHHRALKQILCYRDTSKQIEKVIRDKVTKKPLVNPTTGKVRTVRIHPTIALIDKEGRFPTGLLYIVEHYLKKHSLQFSIGDTRKPPKLRQFRDDGHYQAFSFPFTPYPEQEVAGMAAREHKRGIIVAPTGVGKSIIIAIIIEKLQVPTLIVVPSVELKNQLTASLREIFGKDMVGPLNKGKKAYMITVENVDQLDTKKRATGFDCVIIDEFHRSGSMTYRTLNEKCWDGIYYKFGLTATPFRSNEDERLLLEGVLSKVIYDVDYHKAVDKGYIVPMETYYIDLPKLSNSARTWQTAYKELVVNRKDRNEIICDMIENLHEQDIPTLVLVKQIDHGLILQNMLEKRGLIVNFANGKDGNNKELIQAFNHRMFPVLIGTTGVIGEGIDTKPCEYVIMAAGGKSKNQFMQNLGRGFRRYGDKQTCKIVMFRDPSNKWLLQHFNECKKYLAEEYACAPSKLII